MRILTYIMLAIIVLFGITFACLNAEPVTLNFYMGKHSIPLSLLLALTFTFGCLVGLFFAFIVYIKQRGQIYSLSHRIKTAEKEINNLRTIPLKDSH